MKKVWVVQRIAGYDGWGTISTGKILGVFDSMEQALQFMKGRESVTLHSFDVQSESRRKERK